MEARCSDSELQGSLQGAVHIQEDCYLHYLHEDPIRCLGNATSRQWLPKSYLY